MKWIPAAHELLSDMRAFFQANDSPLGYLSAEPIRAELLSTDQMESLGKALAETHKLSTISSLTHSLLKRFSDNEVVLHEVRKLLTDSIKKKYQITPAGEWLIDNFYLVEEHIRIVKAHSPINHNKGLPQLSEGASAGHLRIYDIVLQLISHSDGRIDKVNLSDFVKAYQSVIHLQLKELWAIPIVLRLALIENIRRISARVAIDRVNRNLANYWAGKMIETAEKEPKNLLLVIADMARSNPPIEGAFISELTRQLLGKGLDLALPLNWIDQQLAESGLTSAELVNAESQNQSADQVSISNSIGSLRILGTIDWGEFVEKHSIVEQILREDNGGIYCLMDFSTRNRYRCVVEYIANESKITESEVARMAIQLMRKNAVKNNEDNRKSHIGYYLVGRGVIQTKNRAKMHMPVMQRILCSLQRHAFKLYLFIILLVTLVISTSILLRAFSDTKNVWLLLSVTFLLLLCTSQLAISVVNFFSTLLVKPSLLPRMDFSHEIPPDFSTLVVIPEMLTSAAEIENLVKALEVLFLANRSDNLYFGLLTNFRDALQETLPDDQALVDLLQQRIEELNKKYLREKSDLFFLFHRQRHWNPLENAWMGYERKYGKFYELNSLLRGSLKEHFSLIIGDQSVFLNIKYVITLDADTQLPIGSAKKLIGTIAHPMNRAWYSEKKKRVIEGYGFLKPGIVSLPDITGSIYARLHEKESGINSYTQASSDIYQDLFVEGGSFIGNGIYEVDTFKKIFDGKFSENSILSQDLPEGYYLKSGLVSDVQLFVKYPSSYCTDRNRKSLLIHGYWQIFSWFLPAVQGSGRHWYKNPISGLSRWKIFDNIRRSLVPVVLTALLLLGWIIFSSPLYWTIVVSAIIVFPIFITSVWDTIRKPKDVILLHHIKNSVHNIAEIFIKTLFKLICLPYEAISNLRVITHTLWRKFITRKIFLEESPSECEEIASYTTLTQSYYSMWIEPFLALVVCIFLAIHFPVRLIIAGPILLLWVLTPLITWWTGKPSSKQISALTLEQNIFLQKLARKTWSFFERFVGQEDNWLPPDNFQEQPVAQIAHRTSPTNIGLSLLSNLSACSFGYITTGQFIGRTTKTINTMEKMERYKGHFYNWYDTRSLNPLMPKYISTVDSGNFIAHLLVLRQGLLVIPQQKIPGLKLFEGLRNTLFLLAGTLEEKEIGLLQQFTNDLEAICNNDLIINDELEKCSRELAKSFTPIFEKLNSDQHSETYWWKQKLKEQLEYVQEDFKIFTPWSLLMTVPPKFLDFVTLSANSTLIELLKTARKLQEVANRHRTESNTSIENEWLGLLQTSLTQSICLVEDRINRVKNLTQQCNELANVEWDFLYDQSINLLTIGYKVQEQQIDKSFYDLLASEARLCTFIGIAQGKLPEVSWFALGRLLTNVDGDPILLSWSGSMFEYLMPLLVMPTYDNTLLDQTYKAVVDWQIKYGKKMGLPWGISESGYNMINADSNYQYRAFGAPGLGLKRGLEEDSVIAPYASALALMIAPEKACKNLELLYKKGAEGRYGFYEAIDYTPSRLQLGQSSAIVYSYMAHHQGMSFLSLAYLLLDKPMQKLFESELQFKATTLLLQEQIPKATIFLAHTTDIADVNYVASGSEIRIIDTFNTPIPEVQLLSNGKYHVMVTNAGAGYSRWNYLAVTRWREDVTCDNWGIFCYIRDLESEMYWSNTHQPTLKKGEKYEVAFSQGRVDFHTTNNKMEAYTSIVVSPEDDVEMRRVSITNRSGIPRTIDVTSYAEVVLASAASDLMQPAFSNLFVQTEIIQLQHAILCTRRPRFAEEQPPWLFHLMTLQGKEPEEISYETDRMEFIGRGNTIVNPEVMNNPGPLSGKEGSVLDPIVAIRYKITLEPEETITIDMMIGMAETKEACLSLTDKFKDQHHKDSLFGMARTHSQVILRQINASEAEAQMFGRLASSVLYVNSLFRADPTILIHNHQGQSNLWSYSISGDLPIVLLKIEKLTNMQLVKQLVKAHAYWRLKGLAVDLVVWNEEPNGYRQDLQNEIQSLIPAELENRPGGIFLRAFDQVSIDDRILFQSVARINIFDNDGTLADHVNRIPIIKKAIPYITPSQKYKPALKSIALPNDLLFFNGLGGFSTDGKEYVIVFDGNHRTPAPWVNVIANPYFGTVISESGTAYSWIENAHELRLTPWNNDPVSDKGGEAFYLRDEENGHFWSTTILPSRGPSIYITRHGFGYSIFEHIEDGIYSEMLVYVDLEATIKFTILKIRNQSGRSRKLSVTGYTEWVLGNNRTNTSMFIHTEIDPNSGALFAKNPYNTEFSNRVAFFDTDYLQKTVTADRAEFIGRNGTLQNPEALSRLHLSGRVGLALDSCAAIQVPFELTEGEELTIIFRLGAGKDLNEASTIARQFRGTVVAQESFKKVKNYWNHTIGALQVDTPDTAINIITNGWLTYQTLSSRLWGRSGYYQSGGAFGFRDQLQDVLSLLYTVPQIARDQILLCASRQFKEGDVQHWWHPPSGRGVRTRCSDDFLWLPFVTTLYILNTGDSGLLDESVLFLEGRQLNKGEESYYDLPVKSHESASLYEHCVRAIRHGFNYGEHGLSLIGTGDWNDGYDKVGNKGKGESVWLSFFLYKILSQFEEIAQFYKEPGFASECKKEALQLKMNINKYAWDGQWYKRAWFDNGVPLGSSDNEECQIDSIAQSWSVLSGAGDKMRVNSAMRAAYKNLVQKEARIIKLLEPPFDKSALNPGYIKGYLPGVRENGGQYTHAAVWMIIAFAQLGDNKRVWELIKMINPINHSNTLEAIARYKVEPYVLAADVYASEPHTGRGGWTWYTGSAAWLYRLIIESFLGMQKKATQLKFVPCIPKEWDSFKVHYRYKNTVYHITVLQKDSLNQVIVTVDGVRQEDNMVTLTDDKMEHTVEITGMAAI